MTTADMKLCAPTGAEIWGTLERTPGVAKIGAIGRDHHGDVVFVHDGGTDMDWDNQRTVEFEGQVVFVDVDGKRWLARELVDPTTIDRSEPDEEGEVPYWGEPVAGA